MLVLIAGMITVSLLAVVALRAQASAIDHAEMVFDVQLGPAIELVSALGPARGLLPDAPTGAAAPASRRRAWQVAQDRISARFASVRTSGLPDDLDDRITRAAASWEVARTQGDRLLSGPAASEDLLAFDRSFRRTRAEAAAVLGALQPRVAGPLGAAATELDRLARWLVVAIGLVSVVSVAVAGALARSIVDAFEALREAAAELAAGDLDARAPRSYGEFDELADVLNLMAERLAVERSALTERATRDGLTGVLNAREIKSRLAIEVERSRRRGGPVALVMLDIDHFKAVNDTYGHQAGDHALVVFARTIESVLRPVDVLGRYGGEEFVLVLPDTDGEAARGVAERVRRSVAASSILVACATLSLTTSAGVSWTTSGRHGADELIADADAALYVAKRQGRDRVELAQAAP